MGCGGLKTDSVLGRLIIFLRKISLFGTCIHIAWSLLVTAGTLFIYFNYLNVDLPVVIAYVGAAAFIVAGVVIWFKYRNDKQSSSIALIYQIFYYYFPIAVSIIKLIFFDSLYSFGGMFPGLDALGLFVYYIAVIVVCVIGCVCFNVVRIIRKKRTAAGREAEESVTGRFFVGLVDVINVLIVVSVLVCAVGFGISYGVEETKKAMHRQDIAKDDEYRTQVLRELIESDVYEKAVWKGINDDGTIERSDSDISLFDEAEEELVFEAYTYMLYVETLAKDSSFKADDCQSIGVSSVTKEVLENGRDDYIAFTKRYVPERGVEKTDEGFHYDRKTQTVSVSAELYCVDIQDNSTVHCCMVVVFDTKWKVIEIRCQETPLKRYVPY